MGRTAIEARLAELAGMKAAQEGRLAAAQQEQRFALQSLERIEGARQDCEFWLAQLAAPGEEAPRNGVCAAAE